MLHAAAAGGPAVATAQGQQVARAHLPPGLHAAAGSAAVGTPQPACGREGEYASQRQIGFGLLIEGV